MLDVYKRQLYFRKRLVNRWNLEQVLEINGKVFNASLLPVSDTEEMLQREDVYKRQIIPCLPPSECQF